MELIYPPHTNLAAAFDHHVAQNPKAIALVVEDDVWTRGEIAELAARAVSMLLTCGVGRGDRVVAQYDTSAEDVALAVAVARLGGTILPIPSRLGVREINHLLERSEARVFAHKGEAPPAGINPPGGATVLGASALRRAEPKIVETVLTDDDHVALIGVTSGSTGLPKGVMHGWSGVAWSAARMRALADVKSGESILVTGAGGGAPGFTFFTYLGLAFGVTIVRAARWDPPRVLKLAKAHRCVWSVMVPTMLQMLLEARSDALGDHQLDDMRAITVGGAFMSEGLIVRAREELGVEVLRMYAMAECMCNASNLLGDPEEIRNSLDGACGHGSELAAFDDTGNRVAAGAVGEIGLRGPSLLKGYLADPAGKSKLMTKDGFFLSGDLGRIDSRGYVKVVGRKKEMINRGGYKIDPSEVEELLKTHPSVAKVVVVGYPVEVFGEKACAVVEVRPRCRFEFQEMVKFLLDQGLSKEKVPERLECRDALPLSPDGKILKAVVKQDIGTNPAHSI